MIRRAKREPLEFCGVQLARKGPTFAFVGPPGSGKTVLLRALVRTALFHRGRLASRACILDIKGDWLAILAQSGLGIPEQVRVSNPMHALCSEVPSFSHDFTDAIGAQSLAAALIPERPSNAPFFDEAARQVISAVIQVFQRHAPGMWELNDVGEVCKRPDYMQAVLELEPSLYHGVVHALSEHAGGQAAGVLASLQAGLSAMSPLLACMARIPGRFSLKEWVKRDTSPGVLLLTTDAEHHVGLGALNQLYFGLATRSLEAMPDVTDETERLWFILDEFAHQRPKLETLLRHMLLSRSKGGRTVLVSQDIASVAATYGSEQVANSLLRAATNLCVTSPMSEDTKRFLHSAMGPKEVEKFSHSQQNGSGGFSESTSTTTTYAEPVSTSGFSTLGAARAGHGVPCIARGDGAWWTGRANVDRFVGKLDERYLELAQARKPAHMLAPKPLTESDAARLGFTPPAQGVATTGLFGAAPTTRTNLF